MNIREEWKMEALLAQSLQNVLNQAVSEVNILKPETLHWIMYSYVFGCHPFTGIWNRPQVYSGNSGS